MPKHVITVGYTDGLALVIIAKNTKIVQGNLNQAMYGIKYGGGSRLVASGNEKENFHAYP